MSRLPSGMEDRSSAVPGANVMLASLGSEDVDWAWVIITGEGSVPSTFVNEGESSRDIRPCPQPRSRRDVLGPWW